MQDVITKQLYIVLYSMKKMFSFIFKLYLVVEESSQHFPMNVSVSQLWIWTLPGANFKVFCVAYKFSFLLWWIRMFPYFPYLKFVGCLTIGLQN